MLWASFVRMQVICAAVVVSAIQSLTGADRAHVILISIDGFAAYHLENQDLELPNIRDLVQDGTWAESSRSVFPSVTHPSHATLSTGVLPRKHGLIGNSMRNRETGESFHISTRTRAEAIQVQTIFDAAKSKGKTTAAFFWPETKGDPSVDFYVTHEHSPPTFDSQGDPDVRLINRNLLEALRRKGIPIDLYFKWYSEVAFQPARNLILAQAAAYVVEQYRPELLAFLVSVTDSTQHSYGPDHYMSKAALTVADQCVGILREAVRAAGLEAETTFIITADHGFYSVQYETNIYAIYRNSGLGDGVVLHPSGWTLFVELANSFDPGVDTVKLNTFFSELGQLAEVERIVQPEEFHELGYPRYDENIYVPGHYMIIADIDTYLIVDPARPAGKYRREKPAHGHGYLPDHPRMYPAFVISGARVAQGKRIDSVHSIDVAPTISELLDLGMQNLEGRVLHEALVSSTTSRQ